MSMCLVLSWKIGFATMCKAALLSQKVKPVEYDEQGTLGEKQWAILICNK